MAFFRHFFDGLLLNKGGRESGALKLPKICVFGLKIQLFQQKRQKNPQFFIVDDTRYQGFDTRYCSLLWKDSRSRHSINTQYDILKADPTWGVWRWPLVAVIFFSFTECVIFDFHNYLVINDQIYFFHVFGINIPLFDIILLTLSYHVRHHWITQALRNINKILFRAMAGILNLLRSSEIFKICGEHSLG